MGVFCSFGWLHGLHVVNRWPFVTQLCPLLVKLVVVQPRLIDLLTCMVRKIVKVSVSVVMAKEYYLVIISLTFNIWPSEWRVFGK